MAEEFNPGRKFKILLKAEFDKSELNLRELSDRLNECKTTGASFTETKVRRLLTDGASQRLSEEGIRALGIVLNIAEMDLFLLCSGPRALVRNAFCPKWSCPTALAIAVGGLPKFLPDLAVIPSYRDVKCPLCGERLLTTCKNQECKTWIVPSSRACPKCDTAYIDPFTDDKGDGVGVHDWSAECDQLRERRKQIRKEFPDLLYFAIRWRRNSQNT